MSEYETIQLDIENKIAHVQLNRPEQANAMNMPLWHELKQVFEYIDRTPEIRVAVLSGKGRNFCSGIDLGLFQEALAPKGKCEGRKRESLRRLILDMQDCLSAIEKCRKPVIAAIHGGCIGGGVDMVTACDMRYSTTKAYFTIKEIDLGMTADVGTLQRLPHLIGDGMMRELAYTGRKVTGKEAREIGLVNRDYEDQETLMTKVMKLAGQIATKSPLAIRGVKEMILYTRDHTVDDSLNYIATWNASMLLSDDIRETMQAQVQKRKPEYED